MERPIAETADAPVIIIYEPDLQRRVVVVETIRDRHKTAQIEFAHSFEDGKKRLGKRDPALLVMCQASLPNGRREGNARVVLYEVAFRPEQLVQQVQDRLGLKAGDGHGIKRSRLWDNFVGTSDAIRKVRDDAQRLADFDVTLLLTGDSGTGKNLLASLIHKTSVRGRFRYHEISCPGLPSELVDSELHGVKRGAFTGAAHDRMGRIEASNGGTILLDEIGEIDSQTQTKLLALLENKAVTRVGGLDSKAIDVRVIAATNKNLEQAIRRKEFRQDLYYRLARFHIHLPSLSERRSDIPVLVESALNRVLQRDNLMFTVSRKTLKYLADRPWRGNVRQLLDSVDAATIRARPRKELRPEDFSI